MSIDTTKFPYLHDATLPRDTEARQKTWHDASGGIDSDVHDVTKAAEELQTYVYGLVHEGEALDRRELLGYMGSLFDAVESVESSVYSLGDIGDEDSRRARAILAARERDTAAWCIERDAPQGAQVTKLRIHVDPHAQRWTVNGFRDDQWIAYATVTKWDLALALRYACGFYAHPSPQCDELAAEIVKGLLDETGPHE